MIGLSAAGRGGTPDKVANVAALLMGRGGLITGSDFLMDGGVTAAYRFGELAPARVFASRGSHHWNGAALRRPSDHGNPGRISRGDNLCAHRHARAAGRARLFAGSHYGVSPAEGGVVWRHPKGEFDYNRIDVDKAALSIKSAARPQPSTAGHLRRHHQWHGVREAWGQWRIASARYSSFLGCAATALFFYQRQAAHQPMPPATAHDSTSGA